jgi:hypothetical protein
MNTFLSERTKTRTLLSLQTTETGAQAYALPTPGAVAIVVRANAKMGNAADLVLSLKYADDAAGTNATAWPVNVPIFKTDKNVASAYSTSAKAYTLDESTGDYVVDFCIDPATVPAGKYVGVSYAKSNAGTLLTTTIIEELGYRPIETTVE